MMKEVLAAIERHLGRSIDVSELDYYQVVGLELYCDDPGKIRKTLQEATNRWLQSDTVKYPESAQIVAKLLRQAQGILLDDEKRERYNHQLKELLASRSESSKATDAASLFPDADPMSPFTFDPSHHPETSARGRCALLEQIQDPQTRLAELEQLFPSLAELDYVPQTDGNVPHTPPPLPRSRIPTGSVAPLTEQILRKRKRKRIMFSVAYLAATLALLAGSIGYYLTHRNQTDLRGKQSQPIALREENTRAAPNQNFPKRDRTEPIKQLPTIQKSEPAPESKMEMTPTQGAAANSAPANNSPPSDAPPMKQESMQEPMKKDEEPAMESSEPAVESPEWKKQMANTRAAIEKADFEDFKKRIELCQGAATQHGRDQAARLEQLGQLYEIGRDSFEEAKKKARGSSALKIGSTQIAIVESTPEKIVLREKGERKSYLWNEVPFGIAVVILDLSLDNEKPTDVAARAIFFSLAPQYRKEAEKNALIEKRIKDWLKKSAGQGDIRADLPQALTDTYE